MRMVERVLDRWRLLALFGALAIALGIGLAGWGTGLERSLRSGLWQLHEQRASGDLHIVEIDARSIAAIDEWPWPRSHHARLIDRLYQAGAASIAFDVDFSSRSTEGDDRALAAALERANGKVILPTFRQAAGAGDSGWIDSLPLDSLRAHSLAASVSILPDGDGYVRRMPIGAITAGVPRPSLSAIIAGRAGQAGADFPIDFGITPSSIPRHSFIDILDSRFNPADLAGKHVLIGATAVEMGDRYVVPLHGIQPGVVLQALATETLLPGVPREAGWPVAVLPAALFAWWLLRARSRAMLGLQIVVAPAAILALALAAKISLHWYVELVPALVLIVTASGAAIGARLAAAARRRLRHDQASGLPNRLALEASLRKAGEVRLVAARIVGFEALAAGLGSSGTAELVQRVRDRIALLTGNAVVHRVEDRVLCWASAGDRDLEQDLATLRTLMLTPIEVGGRRVDVSLALGVAGAPASNPGQIIADAALAAGRARSTGIAWYVHDASDSERVQQELSLLGELDAAIGSDQLEVAYQPKLDIAAGRIISVEALVRWRHPVRGALTPDQFIPLAERNDRISGLTLHVLRRTLADLATWGAAGYPLSGAVNVSAKLLGSPSFIGELRGLVVASGLPAGRLIFEVTESAAMDDPAAAAAALRSFRDLGIRISIDDYGTGQSTLSYLREMPLDELKIDQSFVRHSHLNREDAVLVRSTVDLAHKLGLKVVAEGVEDEACLAFLQSIECDLAQGYLISRPVPAAAIATLMAGSMVRAA
jgi:EAL domain-containing protein (putative c-di-GMP-specific phosphodiesterase class I)/CHASE2 domain-containing sensor protein